MFDSFVDCYTAFVEAGSADPLLETLRLLDVVSNGAVRKLNGQCAGLDGVDLVIVVEGRKKGIPLEYILGRAMFMGLELSCSPAALIPRSETELLVQTVLEIVRESEQTSDRRQILDIGTGSGNIAIALAAHTDDVSVLASDISEEAVALARRNARKQQVEERIRFFYGDLFEPLRNQGYEEKIDLIVCNPPYIPSGSLTKMSSEIVDYEPVVALDAGAYGIGIFRRLIRDAPSFLKPGGTLAFEIGLGQEKIAERLLMNAGGYEGVRMVPDGAGNIRVVCANRK